MADNDRYLRSIRTVLRGLNRLARERARSGDLTPQQADTLQLIAERGAVSTSSLAVLLGIDPSTASRNLAGLERAALVIRRKGAEDGRQTDVRLTPRGKRAAESILSEANEGFAAVLERIPRAERGRITDALESIARIVEANAE